MSGRNSKQQQQAVLGVLDALMPPNAPTTFRTLFPFKQVHVPIAVCISVVNAYVYAVGARPRDSLTWPLACLLLRPHARLHRVLPQVA